MTDEQGRFEVEVAPGDYTVAVRKAGYRDATQDVLGLLPGETREVPFRLEVLPATLVVVVRDSAGNPVPGAEVTITIKTTA